MPAIGCSQPVLPDYSVPKTAPYKVCSTQRYPGTIHYLTASADHSLPLDILEFRARSYARIPNATPFNVLLWPLGNSKGMAAVVEGLTCKPYKACLLGCIAVSMVDKTLKQENGSLVYTTCTLSALHRVSHGVYWLQEAYLGLSSKKLKPIFLCTSTYTSEISRLGNYQSVPSWQTLW